MSDTNLKTRERAELAFAKTQTQFFARSRIAADRDEFVVAQEAKTACLRALRLEKEAADCARAALAAKTKTPMIAD